MPSKRPPKPANDRSDERDNVLPFPSPLIMLLPEEMRRAPRAFEAIREQLEAAARLLGEERERGYTLAADVETIVLAAAEALRLPKMLAPGAQPPPGERLAPLSTPPEQGALVGAARRHLVAVGRPPPPTPPRTRHEETARFIDRVRGVLVAAQHAYTGPSDLDDVAEQLTRWCEVTWHNSFPILREELDDQDRDRDVSRTRLAGRVLTLLEREEPRQWPTLASRFLSAVLMSAGLTSTEADTMLPRGKRPSRTHSVPAPKVQNHSVPKKKRQKREEK